MKRPLNEQLSRIHKLTYGKSILSEDELSDLLNKTNSIDTKAPIDPKKADYVSPDVQNFYDTLNSIDRPLFQQAYGSMQYQKEVESVQIGLILLGYKLPQHGVDGLFGPETAQAINKFKSDNGIQDSTMINEVTLEPPVPIIGVNSPFGQHRSYENHPGVDLKANSGTPIKSPADGQIIDAEIKNNSCGGTIQIKHADGFSSRYCHCKQINVSKGQSVKGGDIVGYSGGGSGDTGKGNSKGAHLHFELYKDGHLVDPMDYIGKEIGSYDFSKTSTSKTYITPTMIKIMVEKLKEKNISNNDLENYINVAEVTKGNTKFSQIDIMSNEGYNAYVKICDNFIKTRTSNILRIDGTMLANGAKKAYKLYKKLVPPELALAQLTVEGGFSSNPNSRPIKTRNPYNVGNVDTGKNVYFNSVQSSIDKYFTLIAGQYLSRGKSASDLLRNFVNREGQRYAAEGNYESSLSKVINKVNVMAQPVYDNLRSSTPTSTSDISV